MIYDQPEKDSVVRLNQFNKMCLLPQQELYSGTSEEKLHHKLGLESVRSRRWLRRMRYFYKLIKTQKPFYLFYLIPAKLNSLRHPGTYSVMKYKSD